jgi:hypothetical protein
MVCLECGNSLFDCGSGGDGGGPMVFQRQGHGSH